MPVQAQITPEFRKLTIATISKIIYFIFVYLLLVALALGVVALCVFGAYALIIVNLPIPLVRIALALGFISFGVMIFIFLIKFIFQRTESDVSGLIEIFEHDQPELFSTIYSIADEVGAKYPGSVYLFPGVNAEVFYNSSFWSMFLPVSKNLKIGVGLINSTSKLELKAILAHEFGHFSQRSMKVGSYVYMVNKVIYNMLYENDSYEQLARNWSTLGSMVAFFVSLSTSVTEGVKKILKEVYKDVNKTYMALSREMEFHADEIAARLAGTEAVCSGLMRIELASRTFDATLNYYNEQISKSIRTKDIYRDHTFVMLNFADDLKLNVVGGLPMVTTKDVERVNLRKLNVMDQWASHPSIEQRILAVQKLGIQSEKDEVNSAFTVFKDSERIKEKMTDFIFSTVTYSTTPEIISPENFKERFIKQKNHYSFDPMFGGYFDSRDFFADTTTVLPDVEIKPDVLFSSEVIKDLLEYTALTADIQDLETLSSTKDNFLTFDYDGVKYGKVDAPSVIAELREELVKLDQKIRSNEINMLSTACNLARKKGNEKLWSDVLANNDRVKTNADKRVVAIQGVVENVQTVYSIHEEDDLVVSFDSLRIKENALKAYILEDLQNDSFAAMLDEEELAMLKKYTSKEWIYFRNGQFYPENFDWMRNCVEVYFKFVGEFAFVTKKQVLTTFASLLR